MRGIRVSVLLVAVLLPCPALFAQEAAPPGDAPAPAGLLVPTVAELQLQKAKDDWHARYAVAAREHARALAASGEPRKLLAAAWLWSSHQDWMTVTQQSPEVIAWSRAAFAAPPRGLLMTWFQAKGCFWYGEVPCDRQTALQLLLRDQPDNAAVHLLAMSLAESVGDPEAVERHWAMAAASTHLDDFSREELVFFQDVFRGPTPPELTPDLATAFNEDFGFGRNPMAWEMADTRSTAIWGALSGPAAFPIYRRCRAETALAASAEEQARCERVLAFIAGDRSMLITSLIGLSMIVKLTAGAPEGGEWRERLRQAYWTRDNWIGLAGSVDQQTPRPADYFEWLPEGELVAIERWFEQVGIPIQAPAGWLPSEPRYRSMVLHGREL